MLTAVFWGQQEAGLQGQALTSPAMLQWCVSRLIFSQHSWNVSFLCPHSWCSGAESQSAALGWGNSLQLILQLEKGAVTASPGAFPTGWGAQLLGHKWHMRTGCAQQSWTATAAQPGGFSSSTFPFYSPLWLPSQADLAKKTPMGPPPSIAPLEQQFKSIPSLDVFFTQHLNTPSQLQTHRSSADSWHWHWNWHTVIDPGINSWKSHSWKQMFNTGFGISPTLPFKVSFCVLSMVKTPNWRFQFYWKLPS